MSEILLRLRGGLGNQLFQYCAGAYYAKQYDSDLIIDNTNVNKHVDKTRRCWLEKIDYVSTFGFTNVRWQSHSSLGYSRILNRIYPKHAFIDENSLKTITKMPKKIAVFDWFHNKSYAEALCFEEGSKDGPYRKLHLKDSLLLDNASFGRERAALHMRLGDFKLTNWGVLPSDWYLARVKNLREMGIEDIDCFSDDIEESKEIIEKWDLDIRFGFPEERGYLLPHKLLFLLTRYPIFISSNSTLSWWASFFNQNQNPTILCNWRSELRLDHWSYFE